MRKSLLLSTLITLAILTLTGCGNSDNLSNPMSPAAGTTGWRTMEVSSAGGTFSFSDIGATVTFPADQVPLGEVQNFQIRLFPSGIPLVPSGPVLVRLGTFELSGPDITFTEPVQVDFRIVDQRTGGMGLLGYALDQQNAWGFSQNTVLENDGIHTSLRIDSPGIYGVFQPVELHVEATVSSAQGPIPLSVGFKAIVTGGTPSYSVLWWFGDDSDPEVGFSVAHLYPDPGTYTATVVVTDGNGNTATDFITIQAYAIQGPQQNP
jgi:hypothetical protein